MTEPSFPENGAYPQKRANPRLSFVADAEVAGLREGTSVVVRISELSALGCYVDTINPVPIGAILRLRIRYGGTTCDVPGRVIYTHAGFGMGVRFEDVGAAQKAVLDAWLDELAKQSVS